MTAPAPDLPGLATHEPPALDSTTAPAPAPTLPTAPRPHHRATPPRPSARPGNSRPALRAWLIDELLAPAFRPRSSTEPVWAWADRQRLPVEHAGVFDSARRPHCRRYLAATADPALREQHVMKASRSGYTQATLMRIAHMATHDPGNVQLSAGSRKNSEEINRGRLQPMFRHLGLFAKDSGFDPDDATAAIIRLGAMSVRISGSYTAGAFRTNAIRFFVNDDSELVTSIPGIGTPADGARSRIRGIEGAQFVSISRPDEWASPHHRDVATGTLEAFIVPCPHCGTYQELTIDGASLIDQLRIEEDPDQRGGPAINPPRAAPPPRLGRLRFDHCRLLPGLGEAAGAPAGWDYNRILADTYYECVSGCRIDEAAPLTAADLENETCSFSPEVRALHAAGHFLTHKQAMALSGRHLATNPQPLPADGGGPRSKRSEHNTDLISLDFDMTWGHFAKKYAERAHDSAALRNFFAEHCGIPFRPRDAVVSIRDVHECRAPYARGTVPFEPDLVTLCADTQDDYWAYVVAAGRLDTTGHDWAEIAVCTWGLALLKSDLIAALKKPIRLAADPAREYLPHCGLVDAGGHRTDDVYELHFDTFDGQRHLLYPSYGRGAMLGDIRPTWQKRKAEAWRGATFDVCYYVDDFWQTRLTFGSIKRAREIRACIETAKLDPSAKGLPPRLLIPGSPLDAQLRDFEDQLINEIKIDGKWTKTGRQDFRDALKQCYASFDLALPAALAARTARQAALKKSP